MQHFFFSNIPTVGKRKHERKPETNKLENVLGVVQEFTSMRELRDVITFATSWLVV